MRALYASMAMKCSRSGCSLHIFGVHFVVHFVVHCALNGREGVESVYAERFA